MTDKNNMKRIQVDPQQYNDAKPVLAEMDLSVPQAIGLFLEHVVEKHDLGFNVKNTDDLNDYDQFINDALDFLNYSDGSESYRDLVKEGRKLFGKDSLTYCDSRFTVSESIENFLCDYDQAGYGSSKMNVKKLLMILFLKEKASLTIQNGRVLERLILCAINCAFDPKMYYRGMYKNGVALITDIKNAKHLRYLTFDAIEDAFKVIYHADTGLTYDNAWTRDVENWLLKYDSNAVLLDEWRIKVKMKYEKLKESRYSYSDDGERNKAYEDFLRYVVSPLPYKVGDDVIEAFKPLLDYHFFGGEVIPSRFYPKHIVKSVMNYEIEGKAREKLRAETLEDTMKVQGDLQKYYEA